MNPGRSMRAGETAIAPTRCREAFAMVGRLGLTRRLPAALGFGEQFAVVQVAVHCFDAETTQCSKDSSHIFDDCTHDFLSVRVLT